MVGVSLEQWKSNVDFAVTAAAEQADNISIGGLSTGGALGFTFAADHPLVNGDLLLFSAAFALHGGPRDSYGRFLELMLTTPIPYMVEARGDLIGANPCRYKRVPYVGARELVRLMRENDGLIKAIKEGITDFSRRVFSAWSEDDRVVSVAAIRKLSEIFAPGAYRSFIITQEKRVGHTSVVLEEPILGLDDSGDETPLEFANPYFDQMMEALADFVHKGS
jgi:pimeloyl-ACP methyl ester carboxylesterase